MTTTPNMDLTIPIVTTTVGPTYATNINNDLTIIDAHNHIPSQNGGVAITVEAINITNDLTYNNNNATELRTTRFYNESSFTPDTDDKTCLYALNNELHYIDGEGNDIQLTLDGSIDLASVTNLTVKDDQFTLEYFNDVTKTVQFSCINVPTATQRIFTFPVTAADDNLVTDTSASTMTNKTITNPVIAQQTSGTNTMTWPTAPGTAGQLLSTNGAPGVISFVSSPTVYSQLSVNSSGTPFNSLTSSSTVVFITGSTPSVLNGLAAGLGGQVITLSNNSGQVMTINYNSGSATYPIITSNAQPYYLYSGGQVQLTFNSSTNNWYLTTNTMVPGDLSGSAPPQYAVGEIVDFPFTLTNTTSGVTTNLASFSVPPGDWDVYAQFSGSAISASTSNYQTVYGASTSSSTFTGAAYYAPACGTGTQIVTGGSYVDNIQVSSSTPYYFNVQQVTGTTIAYTGKFFIRRRT